MRDFLQGTNFIKLCRNILLFKLCAYISLIFFKGTAKGLCITKLTFKALSMGELSE